MVRDSDMPHKDEWDGFSTESLFPHFYLKSRPERNASFSPRIIATVLSVRHVTQLGYLLGFFEIAFDFRDFRTVEAAKTEIKDNLLKHVEFLKLNYVYQLFKAGWNFRDKIAFRPLTEYGLSFICNREQPDAQKSL